MGEQQDEGVHRIAQAWATAGQRSDDNVLTAVTELVAQRPAGDWAALYEQASVFDFVGHEADAEPYVSPDLPYHPPCP